MDYEALKGKTVLVTGAGGFVGGHLARRLTSLGAIVVGLSRKHAHGIDVTDRDALGPIIQKKPRVIFHLAGEALVEKGQEAPYDTFRTNVLGTLNILELARLAGIPRVVIGSTAHVYGVGVPPFHEDSPPRPSRPYETSKTVTDLLAQSYADSFSLPVVIPRFVNIYGPGDTNFTRLIPKTLKYILTGRPVPIWGGSAKREYLYIDDAVEAYILLATISEATVEKNRIFNFGAGKPVAVEEIIRRIGKLAGIAVKIQRLSKGREGEILEQYVSWEKATRVLGWKPRVSLDEGLARTISWWREHA